MSCVCIMSVKNSVCTEVLVPKNNNDWVVSISRKTNRIYYFNSKTNQSIWHKPEELLFTNKDLEKLQILFSQKINKAVRPNDDLTDITPLEEMVNNVNELNNDQPLPKQSFQKFKPIDTLPVESSFDFNTRKEPNQEYVSPICKSRKTSNSMLECSNFYSYTAGEIQNCFPQEYKIKSPEMSLESNDFHAQSESGQEDFPSKCNFQHPKPSKANQDHNIEKSNKNLNIIVAGKRKILQEKNNKKIRIEYPTFYSKDNDELDDYETEENLNISKEELNDEADDELVNNDSLSSGRNESWTALDVTDDQNERTTPELYIVLDTNIFLSSLWFIKKIKNEPFNEFPVCFMVPYKVLEELEGLKRRKITTKRVRLAIAMIYEDFCNNHPRIIGQTANKAKNFSDQLSNNIADDSIINCCLQLRDEGHKVVLFTADKNLTSRALMNGIESIRETEIEQLQNNFRKNSNSDKSESETRPVEVTKRIGRKYIHFEQNESCSSPRNEDDSLCAKKVFNIFTTSTDNIKVQDYVFSPLVDTSVNPRNILRQTIPKNVSDIAHLFVSKLTQSLLKFLSGVLHVDVSKNKDEELSRDVVVAGLRKCLNILQWNWTEITLQTLLEEDVVNLRILKELYKPVEDMTWTVTSVEQLMNAVKKIRERIQESNKYILIATSFNMVILREIEHIKRLLKEAIRDGNILLTSRGKETEILIAKLVFEESWHRINTFCCTSTSTLTSKKEDPKFSSDVQEIMNFLSNYQKIVTDLYKGIKGILKEDQERLTLTHPSIQLLYSTLELFIPPSTPLPGTSASTSQYCMGDLTPSCILAYCRQPGIRHIFSKAEESYSNFSGKINQIDRMVQEYHK